MQTTIIVTHPKRIHQAQTLAEQVGATLSVDEDSRGASWNHDQALQLGIQAGTEWITILEDDAILCDDWTNQTNQALQVAPTPIVSWYLGTSHPRRKQTHIATLLAHTSAHWIVHHELRHAVAYTIHRDTAAQLQQALTHITGESDKRLTIAAKQTGHLIAYSNPSLADHADSEPVVTQRDDNTPRHTRRAHHHGTRTQWEPTNTTLY